ncbi:MAG: glycosyltransferase family 9 protein, partial [Runella zeae]
TPVIRCLKEQLKNAELHYATKARFSSVLKENPYIDQLHLFNNSVKDIIPVLKKEKFDLVIDLHHNLRSLQVKSALKCPSVSFDKLNLKKWAMVNLKLNRLPDLHIVDRYLKTTEHLGVQNDHKGLDYFIAKEDEVEIKSFLPNNFQNGFHALVAGGSYFTKQIPANKIKEIIELSDLPIVLLGGKEEQDSAEKIASIFSGKAFNACGKLSLNQSASIIKQANKVISSDTGLMHIASAYKKEIHSLWGNTIKEFGMYPYLPGEGSKIHEISGLKCRPCSKLGYKK